MPTDYAALAEEARKKAGGVDYAALAEQARGGGESSADMPAYATPKPPLRLASDDQKKEQGYVKNVLGDWRRAKPATWKESLTGKYDQPMHQSDPDEGVPYVDTAAAFANKRPLRGAVSAIQDAAPLLAPLAAPAMAAAPIRSLFGVGAGLAGQQGGKMTAEALGADPDEAELYGYGAGALLGGLGSSARTARVAKGVKGALPELLPQRFKTAYRLAADSFQDAPAPKTPVAFPDTPTTDINSTRGPMPLPPPHDPTPQWEGMPQPLRRTRAPSWAGIQAEQAAAPTPTASPMPPPRLPSGRIPGPTWLAGGPDEAAMAQLPPQVRPPASASPALDMPPAVPRPLSPRLVAEPPEAFMNTEKTGVQNEFIIANRQRVANTAAAHISKEGITADQIESLAKTSPKRHELFWENAAKIPGATKQKAFSPETRQMILDMLRTIPEPAESPYPNWPQRITGSGGQ